jgi:hypothetical protein
MFHSPTTNGFGATTVLKKRLHNHYFNQTNRKKQSKQKTKPKKQPIVKLLHTKVLQQQPKINLNELMEKGVSYFKEKKLLVQATVFSSIKTRSNQDK